MEQVLFSLPLKKLEPIFKNWTRSVILEVLPQLQQNNQDESEQLLIVPEVAELLNLSIPTIYKLVQNREIPFMKKSKRLYFSKLKLIEYLKTGRKKSNYEIEEEAESYLINKKGGKK